MPFKDSLEGQTQYLDENGKLVGEIKSHEDSSIASPSSKLCYLDEFAQYEALYEALKQYRSFKPHKTDNESKEII